MDNSGTENPYVDISEFQDYDAVMKPVVTMSVDNVDNIESNDNVVDSGDEIVDNTLESVEDHLDSNLYDNVAQSGQAQLNLVSVCNDCIEYGFEEEVEEVKITESDPENIQNPLVSLQRVSV